MDEIYLDDRVKSKAPSIDEQELKTSQIIVSVIWLICSRVNEALGGLSQSTN